LAFGVTAAFGVAAVFGVTAAFVVAAVFVVIGPAVLVPTLVDAIELTCLGSETEEGFDVPSALFEGRRELGCAATDGDGRAGGGGFLDGLDEGIVCGVDICFVGWTYC
jgi:hypothetical protein